MINVGEAENGWQRTLREQKAIANLCRDHTDFFHIFLSDLGLTSASSALMFVS